MGKGDSRFLKYLVHIIGYHFRISGHYRAVVMVLRAFVFLLFVVDARIEYPLFSCFHECLDMAVNQFGRIAGGVGGNGIYAPFVYFL